jgi:hypothetical protein
MKQNERKAGSLPTVEPPCAATGLNLGLLDPRRRRSDEPGDSKFEPRLGCRSLFAQILPAKKTILALAAFACLGEFTARPAQALTLFGVSVGQNENPANGLGWDNVGSVGGASGIYLGSFATGFWVLTANHVPAGTFGLGSGNYAMVAGSAQQIGSTDLSLFRIASDPMLPNLNLATSKPAFGTAVWMVGFGGGTKNWGTNTREGHGFSSLGSSLTYSISTDFDPVVGEAQGTGGDSGGALFFQSGGNWVLGGVMSAIANANGVDYTIISNVSSYRSQILALTGSPMATGQTNQAATGGPTPIPEPSTYAAILSGLVLAGTMWNRKRKRTTLT